MSRKQSAAVVLGMGLLLSTMALAGCETGRYNKEHAEFQQTSDITTTGKPRAQYQADAQGQPPVPGSPTGAGKNGRQPLNDYQAHAGPGAEEGAPMTVTRHQKDPFQRQ